MERMEIEELKDYYKARVEPYGKSMNEILEEFAKETKAYKQLEEENKKLKSDLAYERTMLDNVRAEYKSLQDINKKLKEERDKYYAEWHLRHS